MKELFVSYELALKLKEKGFNEGCLGWYFISENPDLADVYLYCEGSLVINNNPTQTISAPLYQQVIDWLRNTKYLHIEIQCPDYVDEKWSYAIHIPKRFGSLQKDENEFDTYEECRDYAIEQALKLI